MKPLTEGTALRGAIAVVTACEHDNFDEVQRILSDEDSAAIAIALAAMFMGAIEAIGVSTPSILKAAGLEIAEIP